jgi:hypothetical protein
MLEAEADMILAQALIEKSLLDGMSVGISHAFDSAATLIQTRPWIAIVVAVIVLLALRPRK